MIQAAVAAKNCGWALDAFFLHASFLPSIEATGECSSTPQVSLDEDDLRQVPVADGFERHGNVVLDGVDDAFEAVQIEAASVDEVRVEVHFCDRL
jgi:hypothetical protein